MSNEKTNNITSWRNKLEDADNLPNEILQDKNAAWEKLYGRLQPEAKKTKPVWYWAAAACLLLMLAIPFIINRINDKKIQEPLAEKKLQQKKYIQPVITTPSTEINTVTTTFIPSKKENIVSLRSKMQINNNVIAAPANSLAIKATMKYIQTAPVIDTPLTIEKAVQVLATAPIKEIKKLKIVHANELGSPVIQPDDTHFASTKPSHFNFSKQIVFSTQPGSSTRPAISITNKISPQN
ncbi:MAG: hypothetical protein ABI091_15130 [Ferruginibacter sp.]